jgi:N-hydroxyarylamine O-acetyltransferase
MRQEYFDTAAYLKRIGIQTNITLDFQFLRLLHKQHLASVPFENLDILIGTSFKTSLHSLYKKIVTRRRGGICFELNFLFLNLLKKIGFNAQLIATQTIKKDSAVGPHFDHPAILVRLEDDWLVDVGNARWFQEPLNLSVTHHQNQFDGHYWIQEDKVKYTVYKEDFLNKHAKPFYMFDLAPCLIGDFIDMWNFQWYSPDSKLTQDLVASTAKEGSRTILTAKNIITITRGRKKITPLSNEEKILEFLKNNFQLILDDNENDNLLSWISSLTSSP